MPDGPTILYVEDNADNRNLIHRILNAGGYNVVFAENALEALTRADNQTVDLVLMDINLPDMDGYSLATIMRRMPKLSRTPILAMTANVMKGDRERSLEAGCDGYIQKPVDVDLLPRQIGEHLLRARG